MKQKFVPNTYSLSCFVANQKKGQQHNTARQKKPTLGGRQLWHRRIICLLGIWVHLSSVGALQCQSGDRHNGSGSTSQDACHYILEAVSVYRRVSQLLADRRFEALTKQQLKGDRFIKNEVWNEPKLFVTKVSRGSSNGKPIDPFQANRPV